MSLIFGPMRQLGYVVPSVETAIDEWLDRGVGPWFYMYKKLAFDLSYEGTRGVVELTVALANSGQIQIELIEQHNDTPSTWREFSLDERSGPHHWASWPIDYQPIYERAVASGYRVTQEGARRDVHAAYFRDKSDPSRMIEIVELTETRKTAYDAVYRAAQQWDGLDPIRSF